MSSIEEADKAAAAVAKAPRVRLSDIEAAIAETHFATAMSLTRGTSAFEGSLRTMTICCLVMHNGFIVVGKSAPASPENYDAALGKQFARDDCIRQLWPLMGFALRDKLSNHRTTEHEPT